MYQKNCPCKSPLIDLSKHISFLQKGVSVQGQCQAADDSVVEAGNSNDLDGEAQGWYPHELVTLFRRDAEPE